jgi:NAD(P)-dependent dehydrogenase (short-subunit alcohol dehydrogenase family)
VFGEGKIAVVTGIGPGMGRSIAVGFAARGVDVVLAARRKDRLEAVADEIRALGRDPLVVPTDITDREACFALIDAAVERFGGVDILVNSAIPKFDVKPLVEFSVGEMQEMVAIGLVGVTTFMQAAFPWLRDSGHGRVVNFGSGAGVNGAAGYGTYAPVKEAVRALTRVASREWGKLGITVNAICPYANSPSWAKWSDDNPGMADLAVTSTSVGRIGDCEHDVGAAAAFLCSDAASYITGHTLMVDGGQSHL